MFWHGVTCFQFGFASIPFLHARESNLVCPKIRSPKLNGLLCLLSFSIFFYSINKAHNPSEKAILWVYGIHPYTLFSDTPILYWVLNIRAYPYEIVINPHTQISICSKYICIYVYNIYDNILHGAIFPISIPINHYCTSLFLTFKPPWMASAPGASSESGSCPTTGFTGGYGKGSINGWIVPYLSISIRYLPLSLEGKIPLWVSIEVSRSNVYNPIWWTSGIPRGLSLSNSRHPWFELQPSRP